MKRALITGINGQDGSYLADFLLTKGYEIYGMERRTSRKNRINTAHLEDKITFINGDLADQNSLFRTIKEADPDEIYNLGAMSFVGESWNTPETTGNIDGLGVLRMLEAIREFGKPIKFYQASTSEMFGRVTETPQIETTRFYPRSPYGVSKLYGHWITKNYRESYDIFACSGILFNHESERRGKEFVTRKITDGVAKIYLGMQDHIALGNLDAKRDWGYAPDYVEAMWMMLQHDVPDDYVIATGKSYSIKRFLTKAFNCVGIADWERYVVQDPRFLRPAEVDVLIGDCSKANRVLGWKTKVSFDEMVSRMVANDIKLLSENRSQ
ncbi:GDP-mannose 4,6-dehydratase [Candidatus Pacearchaeota archaeon]|jgi:GDPmannose 4,6-dehydratase|nr:GDP-mannose 4,6-dehydratase [Candidatus Pacearchaeota archaeon]|tara:strand:- start:1421 stop:2395 length:975 start_codon:yes stop_codon:yes gene_type:complete